MEKVANYFSDSMLTFMLLIISLILAGIGLLPVIIAERQLKRYNKTLLEPKKKVKAKPFVSKPYPIVWWLWGFFFLICVFVGYLKSLKDNINSTDLITQTAKTNSAISSNIVQLREQAVLGNSLIRKQVDHDNQTMDSLIVNLNSQLIGTGYGINNKIQIYKTTQSVTVAPMIEFNGARIGKLKMNHIIQEIKIVK